MYTEETHSQWGECREDYHSAVTEPGSLHSDAQCYSRSSKDALKTLLSFLPGRASWSKLGRRGSLTGIACFHRVVQEELLLLHEQMLEEQKEAGTTAAFREPLLCPIPLPVTALSFATVGGSMARQHPLPAGRPLMDWGELHWGTCTNLLAGQKAGATALCQQNKSTQSNSFAGGGWERINCFS